MYILPLLVYYRLGVYLVLRLCLESVYYHNGIVFAFVHCPVLAKEMFAAVVLQAVLITFNRYYSSCLDVIRAVNEN